MTGKKHKLTPFIYTPLSAKIYLLTYRWGIFHATLVESEIEMGPVTLGVRSEVTEICEAAWPVDGLREACKLLLFNCAAMVCICKWVDQFPLSSMSGATEGVRGLHLDYVPKAARSDVVFPQDFHCRQQLRYSEFIWCPTKKLGRSHSQ